MQKYVFKLKRGLAMLLVVVSLMGIAPLDLLPLASAEGIVGSSSGSFSSYVGSGKGVWAPNVTTTPFTRYSLVEYPDEANHPDNYIVRGIINVFPDGTLGANKLGAADKPTSPDVYWVGVKSGQNDTWGDGSGRPLTAADYDVHGAYDLMWYNIPRAWGFMTVADFDAIATQILAAAASKAGIDPNSDEYKQYYDYNSKGKLIADYHSVAGKDDAHISQFAINSDKDVATDNGNSRSIYEAGSFFNALVMMLSVGRTTANPKVMAEKVTSGDYMTIHDFVDEGGRSASGGCNKSYRILVEPGCMLQDKKTGGKWFICTLRDMLMMSHLENRDPNDTTSISYACGPLVRKGLAFLRYQTCDEFYVYNRDVFEEGMSAGKKAGEALTEAILARSDQNVQFKKLPGAKLDDKSYGMGAFNNLIFHKHSGMQVHLNNPPSDGVQGGSYALSIISPYNFIKTPPSTGLRIKKTSNMPGSGPWKFTVTAKNPDGTPFVGTVGFDTFDDTGTCHIEVATGETYIFEEGFPEGTIFTVDEDDTGDPSIVTTVNGVGGTHWEGESGTVVFDNSTDKISFSVTKSVTGGVDKNKKFHFDVKLDPAPDSATYSINGGSPVSFSGGSCTVELKDGETAVFEGLADGTTYTVTEQEADANTKPSGTQTGTVSTGTVVKFVNGQEETGGGKGKLMKVDAHTGKTVGVAHFRFQGAADASLGYFEVNKVFPTDENGILNFQWEDPKGENYLPPGHYKVTEERPPLGYEPTTQTEDLLIKPSDTDLSKALVFKNDPFTPIRLIKTDPNGEKLGGAVFEVYHDGTYEGTVTTGSDGTFDYAGKYGVGLENGTYEFVEIQAPAGYLIPKNNRVSVTIDNSNKSSQNPIEVSMVNYKVPTVKFLKYETGTTTGLAGAFFEAMIDGEILGEFGPTDENGVVEIPLDQISGKFGKQEDSWTFQVRETVAPEGYFIDDENWKTIEVKGGQEVVEFPFHDTKYPEIKIYKRDTNTRELLPGATFDVQIDGTSIGDKTTGEDGTITITWEEYGKFLRESDTDEEMFSVTVTEKTAPEGYTIDLPNTQTKPLKRGDKLLEFEFNDTKYPEIWVRKIDHETGEPLAGMTFDVTIDGKKLNAQFTTREEDVKNNDGWYKIKFEDYKEFLDTQGGWFTDERGYTVAVTETSAPQFYNKDRQLGSEAGKDYTIIRQLNSNSSRVEFTFEDTHYRSLKVIKIDAETNWELKGARFKLRCISLENQDLNGSSSNPWSAGVEREGITNAEGFYVWENLPNGDYELIETAPPQGYHGIDDKDSTLRGYWADTGESGSRIIKITSASGSDGQPGEQNRVVEYTYKNEPKSGLKIYKQDGVNREPIEGARFKITPLAPLEAEPFEGTTDANGIIVIESDLTNGSYRVEEIYVPEPYNMDTTPQYVEIDGKHDAYSIVFNNYADGFVYVKKLDNVTGLPCAGAEFEITKADGTKVDQVRTTDSSGYVKFGPLTPGESYIVTETKAPPGHEITNPNWQSFTVPKNTSGWVKELIFKDDPLANLWLRKVDAETGKGLQGAEFKITDGSGKVVKQNLITDNEGYIKVNGLEKGNYVATEITAPIGYMLPEGSAAETHIYLEYGKTEVILIKNTKPGGLMIRKTDASTREALAGAVFQLYDINDKPIGAPVKTGADGYARWADLEPGQYQVEEIEAPAGYQRTTERRKFEVKKFVSTEYEWTNAEEATITIYKRDGETFLPLAGAEFEIRKTK